MSVHACADQPRETAAHAAPIEAYLLTGTGRCGTMLMSRILSLSENSVCHHERSITYELLGRTFLRNAADEVAKGVDALFRPMVEQSLKAGRVYGESSALSYVAFPEIHRRYGNRSRFVLLVRDPLTFVSSALARGFFDPGHPHPLEHARPAPESAAGRAWDRMAPFEKCAWYWGAVNGFVAGFFAALPPGIGRVIPVESLSIDVCGDLFRFLGLAGFEDARVRIAELLDTRVNATPGLGDGREDNPWSSALRPDVLGAWTPEARRRIASWAGPLGPAWYPRSFPV